jgi:hypothetical protein|uniref:hypothetical protein n=1 Tax=Pseudomonas sp. LM12 TaxID=1449783 RepID=UPI001867644C|nr:hypothetical protein [Pseudomonas sp. LM12]
MALAIVSPNLTADLLVEASPGLDSPQGDVYLQALSALLQPALDQVAAAYRVASATRSTERAFRRFLANLAEGAE